MLQSAVLLVCLLLPQPAAQIDKSIKEFDIEEMDKAIAHAKKNLDKFVKTEKISTFAVKIPITDHGDTEFFWISKVKFNDDGSFSGVIDNDPDMVKNVKIGQKITVKRDEVCDWFYMKKGVMYGNFTLRALLLTMKKEDKDKLMKGIKLSDEKYE